LEPLLVPDVFADKARFGSGIENDLPQTGALLIQQPVKAFTIKPLD